jgi:molybdopterin synthase sulfur carrier subunit
MPTVIVPALLRPLTNGQERVSVRGSTVRQVVDDLDRQFPGIKTHLVEDGELKSGIAVSIDGEMGVGGLLDPVKETSEVYFLPAIGGGLWEAAIRKAPAPDTDLKTRRRRFSGFCIVNRLFTS